MMLETTSKARTKLLFPPVVNMNGRNYVWRSQLEFFKTALVRHSLGAEPEPPLTTRPERTRSSRSRLSPPS